MQTGRKSSLIFLAIFLLSLSLRLSLALVNREANDDHLEVADRILATHTLLKRRIAGNVSSPSCTMSPSP